VKRVDHATGQGPDLEFAYGASGQRISKQVGGTVGDPGTYREHYIRDAQGNVMATYRLHANGAFRLQERPIYGSARVGLYAAKVDLYPAGQIVPMPQVIPVFDGLLRYELNDHLGNVGTVVTGRLLPGQGAPHEAEVISAQGYEPFGSLLPGRNYSSSSYSYGFNGKLKDDEVHGATGTSYDFGARIHDPRIGRFLSIDPRTLEYPESSPYSFAANNPIYFIDNQGKNPVVAVEFLYEGGVVLLHLVGIVTVGLVLRDAMFGAHTTWSAAMFEAAYRDNPGWKHQQRQERMYKDFARLRDLAFAESIRRNLPNPGPDGSDPNGYEKIAKAIGAGGAIVLGTVEILQSMREQAAGEKLKLEEDLADKQAYVKSKEGTTMTSVEQTKFDAYSQYIIPLLQEKIQSTQDVIEFTDDLIQQSQAQEDYENPGIMRQDNTSVGSGISGGQ